VGVAIALYVIEFAADKVPYVDNAWDIIHTFIRPVAAAVLAYGALAEMPDAWRVVAALLAGSVALTSHSSKASTRAAVNASPEPVSNWILSLLEDGVALFLTWLAVTHPAWTVIVVALFLILSIIIIIKFFRFVRRVFSRGAERLPEESVPLR
jgi:ABC-type xylose transport system permease subunit